MRDDEESGFFVIEGFGEGTEYIHLGNWVIDALEDALKVSTFYAICEVKKNGEVYLELIN